MLNQVVLGRRPGIRVQKACTLKNIVSLKKNQIYKQLDNEKLFNFKKHSKYTFY
jgi:hypothetical protein